MKTECKNSEFILSKSGFSKKDFVFAEKSMMSNRFNQDLDFEENFLRQSSELSENKLINITQHKKSTQIVFQK